MPSWGTISRVTEVTISSARSLVPFSEVESQITAVVDTAAVAAAALLASLLDQSWVQVATTNNMEARLEDTATTLPTGRVVALED